MKDLITARGWARQDCYEEGMKEVEKRLAPARTDKVLKAADGADLYTSYYAYADFAAEPEVALKTPCKGTVLILHGFTENAVKFEEVIHAFLTDGWNVAIYDQRGHGRSYKDPDATAKNAAGIYVDHFETYVSDFEVVYDALVAPDAGKKVLFAHSMGGAVAVMALEKTDKHFDKVALSSPMIAPSTKGIPLFIGKLICYGAFVLGKAKQILFFSQPYSGPEDFDTSCASGRARFDWYEGVKAKERAFQNTCPTYRWTLESMNVTKKLLKKGLPESVTTPVRIYSASLDNTVLPKPQQLIAARFKNGQYIPVKGAKHEIYRSQDSVLFPWWEEVVGFINE